MPETKEYLTIVRCAEELEIALKGTLTSIAHRLIKEELIGNNDHRTIVDPRSTFSLDDKSSILATSIGDRVKLRSSNYKKLMKIFRENKSQYKDIIKILDEEFSRQTLDQISPPPDNSHQQEHHNIMIDTNSGIDMEVEEETVTPLPDSDHSISSPNNEDDVFMDGPMSITDSTDNGAPDGGESEMTDTVLSDILQGVRNIRGLTLQLGFSEGDRDDIDKCIREERMIRFIQRWRNLKVNFTWEHLLNALHAPQLRYHKTDDKIKEHLQLIKQSSIDSGVLSTPSSVSSPGPLSPTDHNHQECNELNVVNWIDQRSFCYKSFGSHFKLPQGPLDDILNRYLADEFPVRVVELWFNHTLQPERTWDNFKKGFEISNGTSNTGGISDIQTEDLLAPAAAKKKNRSMIKASHSKLIMDIAKNLNPDDMEEFHELVVELFEAGTIPEADNVKSIFRSLTKMKCWDFLDISNLESIVERFSDDERIDDNMIKIRNYQKNLAGFKAATKITDYFQSSKENDCDSPTEEYISIHEERDKYTERYRSKLSIQLLGDDKAHIKISLQSLEYVEKLWNSLCYQFNMPSLSKVLDSIVEGSIIIHWVVCHTHVQKILDGIRDAVDFFECQFISSVLVEDVCIYDCDDEGVADTKLLNYVKLLTVRQERKMDLTYSSIKEYFPDVNAPIKQDGRTPLMFAAQHGHMILLEPLLDSGADMYRYDRSGETILSLSRPHKKVHEWLNHKLEDKLITAAKDGDYSAVKQLLEFGIDPNATEKDEYKWSALLWACEKGHIEIVDYLLEQGADPNIQDKSNWTGLILASRNGYLDIVRKLLDKKADVNMMTKGLWTGLMWTAQEGHTEVARLLLERGADPKIKDKAGYTPLIQASQDGHLDIVELLVEHCSEINIDEQRINDGWSSLMVATKEGHENIVRYLVDHGADVDFQKEDEVAALHIASYKGFNNIVRYMCLTKKAKVNLQEKDGLTPLMYAVMGGNLAVTRTLFENGHAAVNIAENDNKWTAIFFAVEGQHQEIVEYLLSSGRVDVTQKDIRGQTVVDLAKELNPKAMEYLLKHRKKDTESILEEKRLGISKPINMKSYEPMLVHYKSKFEQLEKTAAAA